ncbi:MULTISPECIES: helix-turn-helix transcriptional regulator [Cohnella]|uniref:helix-turn-helix transcriptional regulator n=1 Tax=Cohnella TaxID=329857 RepID=UPI0009BA78A0|nr:MULTISPECIES: metalloregulator ArsR/SmtB family transcription factor [Cohnella]MBN2983139.1 transcriptional regulator [Cohnella algarum]
MLQQEEGSTRYRLVQLLKTRGELSIGELSKELTITEVAVRRHIHTLERDGLIRSTLVRQAMGRPSSRYALTERADDLFPKNYPHLTIELLSELEEAAGAEMVDRLFLGRRDKLAARYAKRMEGRSLEEKVAELSSIQNAGGYMTEWEPSEEAGSFRLYEYNCPIAQVAGRYRQACQCEKSLFRQLLGAEVERTECLADGGIRCAYAIKQSSASP